MAVDKGDKGIGKWGNYLQNHTTHTIVELPWWEMLEKRRQRDYPVLLSAYTSVYDRYSCSERFLGESHRKLEKHISFSKLELVWKTNIHVLMILQYYNKKPNTWHADLLHTHKSLCCPNREKIELKKSQFSFINYNSLLIILQKNDQLQIWIWKQKYQRGRSHNLTKKLARLCFLMC